MVAENSGRPLEPAAAAEMRALVARAKSGDASVLPRLRAVLDTIPEIWSHLGDTTRQVQQAWAQRLSGGDPLALESVKRQAEHLRAELEGAHPTPLERVLAGNIISIWLECQHAQLDLACTGDATPQRGRFAVSRAQAAQKKLMAATKTLSLIRTLLPRGLTPVVTVPRLADVEARRTVP